MAQGGFRFSDLPKELQVIICRQMTPVTYVAFISINKSTKTAFDLLRRHHAQQYNREIREVIGLLESVEPAGLRRAITDFADTCHGEPPPANLLVQCQDMVVSKGYPSAWARRVLDRKWFDSFTLACTECGQWKDLDEFPSAYIGKKEGVGLTDEDGRGIELITQAEIPDHLRCSLCFLKSAKDHGIETTGWDRIKEAYQCRKCDSVSQFHHDSTRDEPEWVLERTQERLCVTCLVEKRSKALILWKGVSMALQELEMIKRDLRDHDDTGMALEQTESLQLLMDSEWFRRQFGPSES